MYFLLTEENPGLNHGRNLVSFAFFPLIPETLEEAVGVSAEIKEECESSFHWDLKLAFL
jgi:hypothetical protein